MKPLLYLTSVMCVLLGSFSQAKSQTPDNPVYVRSIGIQAGTQGVGVTFSVPFQNHLALRAGAAFLPFDTDVLKTYNNYKTTNDITARMSNIHLLVDWTPFDANDNFGKHFAISGGMGYFFKAKGTFVTKLTEPYQYGEIEIAPEDIGVLTSSIDWEFSLAPYLGLGLQNFNLGPKLGLDLNLGAYYLDKPNVRIVGTNLLDGNEANAKLVEDNVDKYRFLPVVQLSLSYKIK
ncbi:hypothetical protein [Albibacterium bauzanense]|uniref:Outer membrane protein n=1 Tax=Albibacterium bauzanense TaxID=653929 RepID=A0A4R1M005_9SPHI|nr:hypothetical protein [Albibacterium bauzanense]TCK84935.1 hypothetical protein C8N28_0231 [Albibacterium bauzanense]